MQMHTLDHRGYEIVVQSERNELGAWRAKVSVRHTVDTVAQFRPETVSRNGLPRRRPRAMASNGPRG
ncbi:MAG: hypothetical protein QOF46_3529 [Paraburkholderia sp.]|nr:hypothetical protein [Paraburkholderia sp.]